MTPQLLTVLVYVVLGFLLLAGSLWHFGRHFKDVVDKDEFFSQPSEWSLQDVRVLIETAMMFFAGGFLLQAGVALIARGAW